MNIFSTHKTEKVRIVFFSGFLILSLVLSQVGLPLTIAYAQIEEGLTPPTEDVLPTAEPLLTEEIQMSVVANVPQVISEQLSCEQSVNLIENGDFEAPALSAGSWDIIPDSNTLLKWLVAWISPNAGRLGLEIQNNAAGTSFGGTQHAELDGDAPVTIWQDIATIPGKQYSLSFKYSPRPGVLDNALQPMVNSTPLGLVVNADGTTNTDTVWQSVTRIFTATSSLTKVEITDVSSVDSLGGYIDNVSLNCNPKPILQCDANASSDFMSDSFTQVDGHDAVAVATYNPANWTANISGATWIWSDANVLDATVSTTKTFTKNFMVVGTPLDSAVIVAADDGYKISMNSTPLTGAGCFDTVMTSDINEFVTAKNCTIPAATMHTGTNTLSIEVTNFAQADVDYHINPAGLLYKFTLANDECKMPPVDMCPNIEGDQSVVPEGYQIDIDGQCVPLISTSLPQCSDTIDNSDEEDILIDIADPACHSDHNINNVDSYTPNVKSESNTESAQCSDGISNDTDGLIDSNDPGCLSGEGGSWNPNDTDESNGSSFSGPAGGGGKMILPAAKGSVLGASTQCGLYLDDFLKMGKKNDKEEVKKLQGFLNDYLKLSPKLLVNGVFGLQTHKAVVKFQEQEAEYVLKPWVGVTLKSQAKGTGWVYKTTVTRINNIMCPELNLQNPPLTIE